MTNESVWNFTQICIHWFLSLVEAHKAVTHTIYTSSRHGAKLASIWCCVSVNLMIVRLIFTFLLILFWFPKTPWGKCLTLQLRNVPLFSLAVCQVVYSEFSRAFFFLLKTGNRADDSSVTELKELKDAKTLHRAEKNCRVGWQFSGGLSLQVTSTSTEELDYMRFSILCCFILLLYNCYLDSGLIYTVY